MMVKHGKDDARVIPKRGVWCELCDFSIRDDDSNWGYILYIDGEEIERTSGYSSLKGAGDAARDAKKRILKRPRKE
jgi:hypothetical protein